MTRRISTICLVVLLACAPARAQQIAAVSGTGVTTLYDDLNLAIAKAEEGSTLYLPARGYKLNDDTKLTRRLTLIGSGHKAITDHADGNTTLSGDLRFGVGSDGSMLMGVYMSDGVKVGVDGRVANVAVRYCNVHNVEVKTDSCRGVYLNQNYVRDYVELRTSSGRITNNVLHTLSGVNGGIVTHNILDGNITVNNTTFTHNLHWNGVGGSNSLNQAGRQGDFSGILTQWKGVTPNSDCHFNDTYEGDPSIGIYGGTGFDDSGQPPVPFFVRRQVSEQTDADGKASVQMSVKRK